LVNPKCLEINELHAVINGVTKEQLLPKTRELEYEQFRQITLFSLPNAGVLAHSKDGPIHLGILIGMKPLI
jgi:hypothetical protein